MKKNRGFTLIELLAVIVLLAIVAIVAAPVFLNVINSSRSDAKEDSARLIIKSVHTAYATAISKKNGNLPFVSELINEFNEMMDENTKWIDNKITSNDVVCNVNGDDSEIIVSCNLSDDLILSTKKIALQTVWGSRGLISKNVQYGKTYYSSNSDISELAFYSNGGFNMGIDISSSDIDDALSIGKGKVGSDYFAFKLDNEGTEQTFLLVFDTTNTVQLYLTNINIGLDKDEIIRAVELGVGVKVAFSLNTN